MRIVTTKTYKVLTSMNTAQLIEKIDREDGLDSLTLDDAIDQVVHNYVERRNYNIPPEHISEDVKDWIWVNQDPTRYLYEDCPDQYTMLIQDSSTQIYNVVPFTDRPDYMELHTTALGLMGSGDLANEDWGPDGLYQQIMGHLAALVDITPNKKWSFTTDDD